MPLPTTTEQILRSALSQATATPADRLPDDGHLERDFGVDSLALHELIVTLENALAVTIPDEEVGRLHTLDDLRALLARLAPQAERISP